MPEDDRRERVRLRGAQRTLLWTLYFRARDTRTERPIVDDRWAPAILDRTDANRLALWLRSSDRYLVLLRARQLDRWTSEFLAEHQNAIVLQLGCGLDSRAYRLELPETVLWYDVDYPEVIALHRKLYPDRPNHYTIGSSVIERDWMTEVPSDRPTLVIAEGLFPYLEESDIRALLDRLMDHLGEGQLMFDGIATWAARKAGRMFRFGFDDPTVPETWNDRLSLLQSREVIRDWSLIRSPFYRGVLHAMMPFRTLREVALLARYRF